MRKTLQELKSVSDARLKYEALENEAREGQKT